MAKKDQPTSSGTSTKKRQITEISQDLEEHPSETPTCKMPHLGMTAKASTSSELAKTGSKKRPSSAISKSPERNHSKDQDPKPNKKSHTMSGGTSSSASASSHECISPDAINNNQLIIAVMTEAERWKARFRRDFPEFGYLLNLKATYVQAENSKAGIRWDSIELRYLSNLKSAYEKQVTDILNALARTSLDESLSVQNYLWFKDALMNVDIEFLSLSEIQLKLLTDLLTMGFKCEKCYVDVYYFTIRFIKMCRLLTYYMSERDRERLHRSLGAELTTFFAIGLGLKLEEDAIAKALSDTYVEILPWQLSFWYVTATLGHQQGFIQLTQNNHALASLWQTGLSEKNVLHIAAEYGQLEMLTWLLAQASVKIEARAQYGNTALHFAVRGGYIACAQALLEKGADLNTRNDEEKTPLSVAAAYGDIDTVHWLLTRTGIEVNARDIRGNTPLFGAIRDGHLACAQALVNKGADYNIRNEKAETPLHIAAANGDIAIVNWLLSLPGMDINARDINGNTPLLNAVKAGHFDCIQVLIQHGADRTLRSNKGKSILHRAASSKKKEVLEWALVQPDVDINERDYKGNMPSHRAAKAGALVCLQILVRAGANMAAQNNEGDTVLFNAYRSSNIPTIEYLVTQFSANINTFGVDAETVLRFAAECWEKETMKLLVQAGVNPYLIYQQGDNNCITIASTSEDGLNIFFELGVVILDDPHFDDHLRDELHDRIRAYQENMKTPGSLFNLIKNPIHQPGLPVGYDAHGRNQLRAALQGDQRWIDALVNLPEATQTIFMRSLKQLSQVLRGLNKFELALDLEKLYHNIKTSSLQAENKQLSDRIETLEAQNKALENRVKVLETQLLKQEESQRQYMQLKQKIETLQCMFFQSSEAGTSENLASQKASLSNS